MANAKIAPADTTADAGRIVITSATSPQSNNDTLTSQFPARAKAGVTLFVTGRTYIKLTADGTTNTGTGVATIEYSVNGGGAWSTVGDFEVTHTIPPDLGPVQEDGVDNPPGTTRTQSVSLGNIADISQVQLRARYSGSVAIVIEGAPECILDAEVTDWYLQTTAALGVIEG